MDSTPHKASAISSNANASKGMSCDEPPHNVGQLHSKAYEFWKERESQAALSDSPGQNAAIQPRTSTLKPYTQHHDLPPRPIQPPSKHGSSISNTKAVLPKGGEGDVVVQATSAGLAVPLVGQVPIPPRSSPAPISPTKMEQNPIAAGSFKNSLSQSFRTPLKAAETNTTSSKTKSVGSGSHSDAASYMPKGGNVFERASSEKVAEHKRLGKSSFSLPEMPQAQSESRNPSWSLERSSRRSSDDAKGNIPLRPKKFVPRIETIRASTGDRLSKDDMDLLSVEMTGRVMALAKEMNSAFLSPQQHNQQGSPPILRQRHGSTGETILTAYRDVARTKSTSPAANRRYATSASAGPRHSAVLCEASTPTANNDYSPSRNWRSQSASKVRSNSSVKIKSSGFISYLDGPVNAPLDAKPPRPLSPPPLSPLHAMSNFLKDSDVPEGNHLQACSSETRETTDFWDMVQRLQSQYCHREGVSLTSPILSQTIQSAGSPSMSRRHESICWSARRAKDAVVVRMVEASGSPDRDPVEFTCNVKSIVYTVLSKGVDLLRKECGINKSAQSCALKVRGIDEILEDKCLLCDYEYIHQCRKFSTPVELVVVDKQRPSPTHLTRQATFPGTNSSSSSSSHSSSSPTRLSSPTHLSSPKYSAHVSKCLSIKEANYLLDGFHAKEDKFRNFLESKQGPSSPYTIPTMVQSVVSCVKLFCERMSFIEPPEVTDAVFNLRRACKAASQPDIEASSLFSEDAVSLSSSASDNWVAVPDGGFCLSEDNVEDVVCGLDVLHNAVHRLVSLYCTSFHPGYAPKWEEQLNQGSSSGKTYISSYPEQLLRIKIAALHRPYLEELQKFDTLQLECCIYHGGKALSKKSYSPHAKLVRSFGNTVVWNKWINMSLRLIYLTPESRVMFTLHGLEFPGSGIKWSRTPIAWTIMRLFDCRGCLVRGGCVLGMWLGEDADPLDSPYHNMHNKKTMLLQVEFEDRGSDLYHSPTAQASQSKSKPPGPPPNVSKTLISLAQRDRFYNLTTADQKMLWANRLSCVSLLESYPRGLPVLLLAAKYSDIDVSEVLKVVQLWKSTYPVNGLDLLDPQFSSMVVRAKAVEWLSKLNDDDICDFLTQLVLSVQYDSSLSSPMVQFLLQRSTKSHRIAHGLFWNVHLVLATNARFRDRYEPILVALNKLCGEQQQLEFSNQVELVEQLCAVAVAVKNTRDSHRQTTLVEELQGVADKFVGKFRLPLNPSLLVKSIDIESCSFFNSNTVPLKLSFTNADPFGDNISIIFKVGDDLRQDILILQMIRLMEKIWLRAGLDLKMVTYQCVATGKEEGMLEMVQEASTLRTIQMEHGVTGSFKDKPLSEWLQRHNPTESAYRQAVENFTLSCAGYCVATYVLGICDRHNDNIMVKKSGHMFHIDFGKILGNAQMFGNIRRDRAPFVLTRDMAYVINDGDKPTAKFQQFCDLCCSAYNELRKHTTLFVSLLSLILSSGLPEVNSLEDVRYVRDALLPDKSEPEATYAFTKYIEDSLGSMATTLNFFIHNLAQFKFGSPSNAPSLLSFCPQTYSIATSGKIESAIITTYHKWFYPETYYVYQIEVKRSAPDKEKIFRRYREFDELQNKVMQCFPDMPLPQLPGKILIPGKSHTKQTTERRMVELNMYLASLLCMPRHISESDIVYTFLHCLIRDEQDLAKLREDEVQDADYSSGKVKLEMLYNSKQEVLSVMVRHVKGLMPREGSDSADPYVKLYLLPDPNKSTKQKTKVTKKTLNPTYNETFVYSLPASALKKRALQLSIWDAANVLGNHCMCMTTIELSRLTKQLTSDTHFVEWFELFTIPNL